MSRVAVTGANGFIGSRIVRVLLARGHQVVALGGPDRDDGSLDGLDVERRPLELLDPESVHAALEGADQVVHTAACYSFWESDSDHIYRVNVEGTCNVLAAARTHGCKKLVYTSSTATLMPSINRDVADESSLYDARRFQGHYKVSKVIAEMAVLREIAKGLPGVIVHPTTVLGEGDRRPTPTGTIIVHFITGRMKAYAGTVMNVVDADDVAEGHVLALEKGRVGHQYVLGGENLSMREITQILSELTGLPAPRLRLHPALLRGIGRVNEWIADHVSHTRPMADVEAALHAQAAIPSSSDKAIKELGYRPAPARATLAKATRWFVENGFCSERRARRIRAHGAL